MLATNRNYLVKYYTLFYDNLNLLLMSRQSFFQIFSNFFKFFQIFFNSKFFVRVKYFFHLNEFKLVLISFFRIIEKSFIKFIEFEPTFESTNNLN